MKEKVRELVGLTAPQFSQVILLPQGRFEKVLRAGSDERELLLKTLFDTELYEQVADHLDRRARAERDALGDLKDQLDELREPGARPLVRGHRRHRPTTDPTAESDAADARHGATGAERPGPAGSLAGRCAAVPRRRDWSAARAARRAKVAADEVHDERERIAERWHRRAQLLADAGPARAQDDRASQRLAAELDRAPAAEALRPDLTGVHAALVGVEQAEPAPRRVRSNGPAPPAPTPRCALPAAARRARAGCRRARRRSRTRRRGSAPPATPRSNSSASCAALRARRPPGQRADRRRPTTPR